MLEGSFMLIVRRRIDCWQHSTSERDFYHAMLSKYALKWWCSYQLEVKTLHDIHSFLEDFCGNGELVYLSTLTGCKGMQGHRGQSFLLLKILWQLATGTPFYTLFVSGCEGLEWHKGKSLLLLKIAVLLSNWYTFLHSLCYRLRRFATTRETKQRATTWLVSMRIRIRSRKPFTSSHVLRLLEVPFDCARYEPKCSTLEMS